MNFGYINKRKALILSHHGAQMTCGDSGVIEPAWEANL